MDSTPRDYQSHLARFGLAGFRCGQQKVVDTVFDGQDCLCIMPTGGGKSLCFQLPAIAREGTVLVVSPLIALMKDQVDSLNRQGISAACINSSQSASEQSERIAQMAAGELDLVYIAPERMRSRFFCESLGSTTVQLLAIDEAHCISQWGHDFRPDYARLGRLRKQIGSPQTIALTATATERVRKDICEVLELSSPRIFVTGFARENLSLSVSQPTSNTDKDRMLLEFLRANAGSGIIYCSTRKACDHLSELLQKKLKRRVDVYHAGLESPARREIQEAFSAGKIDVIVATNAFGMGIDKSDLRFVIHYNIPGSIEAYYQEAGRAGRDNQPARCELLFSWQDRFIQEFFIENSYPSREIVEEVYRYLCQVKSDPVEITLQELQNELESSVGTEGVRVSETLLEKCGAIERLDARQNQASVRISSELPTIVDMLPRDAKKRRHVLRAVESQIGSRKNERVYFSPTDLSGRLEMSWDAVQRSLRELNKLDCFDYVPPFRGRAVHVLRREPFGQLDIEFGELEERKREEFKRLESVMNFATSNACRQLEILDYFGDESRKPCGHCDNCSSLSGDNPASGDLSVSGNRGCLYVLQVALSGVARSHGRYGKNMVAQMLCGSTSKKMEKAGLRRLSTYGLLSSLNQGQAVEVLECLIRGKLVTQTELQKFRPVIRISERGSDVMRGFELVSALSVVPDHLRRILNYQYSGEDPRIAEFVPDPKAGLADVDDDPTPAPTDDVSGELSNAKVPNGSPDDHAPETIPPADEPDRPALVQRSDAASVAGAPTVRPSWFWTWKLFSLGFSAREVAQIRQMNYDEIAAHVQIAAENSVEVSSEWLETESAGPVEHR